MISSRRSVSDRRVRRREKANVIKERMKMNEKGEGEQKDDERLGLVPVTPYYTVAGELNAESSKKTFGSKL